MTSIAVTSVINGAPATLDVQPRMALADALREKARLTGTHVGCEHGVCASCTVIVDGLAVRSCLMLADEPNADADRIRDVLSGNLCRCTGYIPLIEAVLEARVAYARWEPAE